MIYLYTNLVYFYVRNRQFGFHTYALDMIQAPTVIRRYLARNYDMQNIPIGSKEVINNLQSLPSNIGFFFAGNTIQLKSRYLSLLIVFLFYF